MLAAAGLIVAACGGDDDDDSAADTTAGRHRGTGGTDRRRRRRRATTAGGDDASGHRRPVGEEGGEGGTIRLWLNGTDTPDELVEYAVAEFNKVHPDVTVELERQQWDGIVERLTTALSGSDAPDVVEFGNTQAQTFEAAGAVVDLTDKAEDLNADDFLQSLVEAGTYDGALYAVPYYAGARIMVYRKDLFEESGIEIPTTLEEMLAAGEAAEGRQRRRPELLRHLPAGPELARRHVVRLGAGGDIAMQEGEEWVGQLDSPGVDRRPGVLPAGLPAGQRGAGGRRRRPRLPCVLRRRGRHDAGAGLEAGSDHQRGRRVPRHGGEHRRVRHARLRGRDDGSGVPRRFEPRPSRRRASTRTWPTTC